jgi:hypothetical protein
MTLEQRIEGADIPLVSMIGNRACITDLVMVEVLAFASPNLAQWVHDNCERSELAAVWLLPVYGDDRAMIEAAP